MGGDIKMNRDQDRKSEQGTALVTTLMFLLAMAVLSTALVFTVNTEMKTSSSFKYNQQAYYVANAAIQDAVQWFNDGTQYVAHIPDSDYNALNSPVTLAANAQPVQLTGLTGSVTHYPAGDTIGARTVIELFQTRFADTSNQAKLEADPNDSMNKGQFGLNATLLNYSRAQFINEDTFSTYTSAVERWRLDSTGYWGSIAKPLGTSRITAEIENTGNALFDKALWGKDWVNLRGTSLIDSYDPQKPLGQGNGGFKGAIGSNGYITGGGNATVQGDVGCGPKGYIDLGANTTVTGAQVKLPQERLFPPVPSFDIGNSDLRISPNKPKSISPGSYRNWDIQGPVTLGPGDYYIDSLSVTGQGQIIITADTNLFVKSALDIEGNSIANFTNAVPAPILKVVFAGGPATLAKITGSSTVAINYYGPNANLELAGGTEFYGSFIAKTVDNKGGATVHFDEGSLARNLIRRPYRIITWSQNAI